jgi:cobalt/nickel transport protein
MAWNTACLSIALTVFTACVAPAHFVVLVPDRDVVDAGDHRPLTLELLFTHPMEQGPVMEMARPRQFGVLVDGKKIDLAAALEPGRRDGKTVYALHHRFTRPGDYVFYVEPAPYWEPGERKFIVHYTKLVVSFGGAEEGWDAAVGLPVEIEPLVRPYGLWTGNTFRGIVKHNGRPVPYATVEVEYNNVGEKVRVPNEAFITQVVKADGQGVFSYSMPKAGWWGFAALVEGEQKLPAPDGRPADVELGGLIWVRTVDMSSR